MRAKLVIRMQLMWRYIIIIYFGQRVCICLLLEAACGLTITSAGIPASLLEVLEDAIARGLAGQLDRINTALDEIKGELAEIKEDISIVARTTALVDLLSNFYFTPF
jgi:hypothetical protein